MLIFQISGTKPKEKVKEENKITQEELKIVNDFVKSVFNILSPKIGEEGENVANAKKLEVALERLKNDKPEEFKRIANIIKEFKAEILEYIKINKTEYYLDASVFKLLWQIDRSYDDLIQIKSKINQNEFTYDRNQFKKFLFSLVNMEAYDAENKVKEVLKNEQKFTEEFSRK